MNVKKFRKVDGELPCEGRLKDIDRTTYIYLNAGTRQESSCIPPEERSCREGV